MYTISAVGGVARRALVYPLLLLIDKIGFRNKSKQEWNERLLEVKE